MHRKVTLGKLIATPLAIVIVGLGFASSASAAGDPGRARIVDRTPADAGETVKLIANSDFKVTGVCEDNGGGDFNANTFLKAKRNNLTYTTYGPETGFDAADDDFDKADGALDFSSTDAEGTMPVLEEAEYYEFYAEGRGGRIFRGHAATSVHYKGADCNFGGTFFVGADSGPADTATSVDAAAGGSVKIYANDDFKLTGTCEDSGGGDFLANTFIEAKRPNLVIFLTSLDTADTDFDPVDGVVEAFDDNYEANGTALDMRGESYYQDVFGLDASGQVFQARVRTAVHADGDDCSWSAVIVGPASGGALKVVNAIDVKRGKTKTLFKNADFKVSGRCVNNGMGDLRAETYLQARRKNLAYYAYDEGTDLDFDPNDGKIDFTTYDANGTDPDFISEDQYTDFWGEGKGGQALNGRVASGVHIKGADCTYAGIFVG